jgi:hypothetical protein
MRSQSNDLEANSDGHQVVAASRFAWLSFPLAVWAAWRVAHLCLLTLFGGHVVDATFDFDGGWFLSVLSDGYAVTDDTFTEQQNVAFFPGLVWLTEPFTWVMSTRTAAFVVANLLSLATFVAVFGSVRSWADERYARAAILTLACWPTSLFLWNFYSDGLLVLATALAFWAEKRSNQAGTIVAIFLAGTTRVIGLGLGPVLAIARVIRLKRVDLVAVTYGMTSLVALGLVGLQQHNQTGDALAFSKAQAAWDREIDTPWAPVATALDVIRDTLPGVALQQMLDLAAITIVGIGVAFLVRAGLEKGWSISILLWTFVAWFAPLWTSIISSQVRFVLGAWPVALLTADLWKDRRTGRPLVMAAAAIGAGLSAVLIRRWANGEWVA